MWLMEMTRMKTEFNEEIETLKSTKAKIKMELKKIQKPNQKTQRTTLQEEGIKQNIKQQDLNIKQRVQMK